MSISQSEQFALDTYVHPPQRASSGYVKLAQELKTGRGVSFHVPVVDEHIIPLRAGKVMDVIARPGHGKCVASGTQIWTDRGWVLAENIEVGDQVMAFNEETNENNPFEMRSVTGFESNGVQPIVSIFTASGEEIHVTENHPLMTAESGWQRADQLKVGDGLLRANGLMIHADRLLDSNIDEQDVLLHAILGAIIGDGHIRDDYILFTNSDLNFISKMADMLIATRHTFYTRPRNHTENRKQIYDIKITDGPIFDMIERGELRNTRSGSKFVPTFIWSESHHESVRNFLATLMECDGHLSDREFKYTSKSRDLAIGVSRLFLSFFNVKGSVYKEVRSGTAYWNFRIFNKSNRIKLAMTLHDSILLMTKTKLNKKFLDLVLTDDDWDIDGPVPFDSDPIVAIEYNGREQTWAIEVNEHPSFVANMLINHNTSVMSAIAKQEALEIIKRGEQDEYMVAYVTHETPVEELDAFFQPRKGFTVTDLAWGRADLDEVVKQSIEGRIEIPVWLMGKSLYNAEFGARPMEIEVVYDGLRGIVKRHGKKPALVVVDYIQRIPVPNERERYMQVTKAAHLVRDLSITLQCPVILGVQSNQRVDDRASPIPDMRDAEWSAAITQDADTVISLWRPIRTYPAFEKPTIKIGNKNYTNDSKLLVIKLLKQRWEEGRGIWAVNMDMATLEMSERHPVSLDEIIDDEAPWS